MPPATARKRRVYLDLTHVGRHVTGIERVAIEQFEKVAFDGAETVPIRAKGVLSMILRQQALLPLLAIVRPSAHFVFPGFPPSPLFALVKKRVTLYVHDTFLITRRADLSAKARLYMAPQFAFAVRHLTRFLVNSEKTRGELQPFTNASASIGLYRPSVANVFDLSASNRDDMAGTPKPLRLISLGTIEPRKNYAAALAILEALRSNGHINAELHMAGRAGWGEDAERIAADPGVTVHGYLPAASIKQLMESADLYLCTSHDEGLGLPLLEAQYAGLPVIAPDAPVFREVLGSSGTFIRTADAAAAADTIHAVMAAPGWRQAARNLALANVKRWNALAAGDLAEARVMFAPDASHSQAAHAAAALPQPNTCAADAAKCR